MLPLVHHGDNWIRRNEEAETQARKLRTQGFITGFSCCMKCNTWVSSYFEPADIPSTWVTFECPCCKTRRSMFFHDDESLDCFRKSETTAA